MNKYNDKTKQFEYIKVENERKPYNVKAGYIASRHNLINDGWVVIYYAKEQGIDDSSGRYAVVCELHNVICNTTSLPKARPFLKYPEFCEECMNDARDEKTRIFNKFRE